jgi:hypothetical protein
LSQIFFKTFHSLIITLPLERVYEEQNVYKYVFQPFWDCHNGQATEEQWQLSFQKSKTSASRALGRMDTQGAEIMGQVVPVVIHLMMNDHQRVWGEACYPVVD